MSVRAREEMTALATDLKRSLSWYSTPSSTKGASRSVHSIGRL
ncbi:MAG: hypothetical protein OXI15_01685 [Chromatiales bacterium]|nr:hypothetical protein [Chromatiales bacterium]